MSDSSHRALALGDARPMSQVPDALPDTGILSAAGPLVLGGRLRGRGNSCAFDDLAIWGRALSDDEVRALCDDGDGVALVDRAAPRRERIPPIPTSCPGDHAAAACSRGPRAVGFSALIHEIGDDVSTDRTLTTSWLAAPLSLLLAASCCTGDDHSNPAPASATGANPPAVVDPHAAAPPAQTAATTKVLQAMDAGTYTYVELEVDGEPTWYAGPKTAVAAGDTVVIPDRTLPMRDFPSAALDRTFDLVYFVQSIRKVGEPDLSPERAVEMAHAAAAQRAPATPSTDVDLTGIPKAEGGMTVAELFALGKEGAGQDIVLRGKVVKYNANILDKNWLHVRDGSGAEGTNDIIVTTGEVADVGDTVLVRGKLAADRDLGFGYKFDLLIEDAAVTIE